MLCQAIYWSLTLHCLLARTGNSQRDAYDVHSATVPVYSYDKLAVPSLPTFTATSPLPSFLNQQAPVVFQQPLVNPGLHIDSYKASFVQSSLPRRNTAIKADFSSGTQAPFPSVYSSVRGAWQPTYVHPGTASKFPSVKTYSSLSTEDPREDITSQHVAYSISNGYSGTSAPETDGVLSTSDVDVLQKHNIRVPSHLQQISGPSGDDRYNVLPGMLSSLQNGIDYSAQRQFGQQEAQGHRQGVVLPNDRLGAVSQLAQTSTNAAQLLGGMQLGIANTGSRMAGTQFTHGATVVNFQNNGAAILPAYTRSNLPPHSLRTASSAQPPSAFMSTPPPNTSVSDADEKTKSTVAILIQQIMQLPAVIYLNSDDMEQKQVEYLLRDTYNLPLVAFYIDKLDNRNEVEGSLQQLTAYKGLPYIFICGKFVGSQQHIDDYHRNGRIVELIEKVCASSNEHSEDRLA